MTNPTSNRSWGRCVGRDHYYSLNVDDQPDFQRRWGRCSGSDPYYSLNADDQPDFKQKLGSMCGKWSLLFSERRWPTWLPKKMGSMFGKWSLLFSERRWPTWLQTEAGVDVWEVIITILWTSMTNLTSNRSWGRWVGRDHYYSLNVDDQPDFQQKLRSMGGKRSLLVSERRWPTCLPTEAGVDVWEVIITILWTSMTNLTSNRSCGQWVGSDHYYSLNTDDQPDFQQKLRSMCGKGSLLFSNRRRPTWLPTEAGVDGWEGIITILWMPMTNPTSNRSWGRWVRSDHYYSLNADDQPDFQQKLGSMSGKWSLLFSEC